jgi:Ni/Co efflux regulator RcnB
MKLLAWTLAAALCFSALPAAAKPDKETGRGEAAQGHGGGKGKPDKQERKGQGSGASANGASGRQADADAGFTFSMRDREIVRTYFAESAGGGACPPGLAKKNNGCQPPGLAKKWQRGQPLPTDVVYYELPPELVIRLPTPPIDHRYVRVAGDILLLATGTSMVVAAIEDLGRL